MKITVEEWFKYFPNLTAELIGDGKTIDDVVGFDTEARTITCLVNDSDGQFMLNDNKTEVLTKILQFETVQLRVFSR